MINQNEDYPGMHFLNSAFDSSTFITNQLSKNAGNGGEMPVSSSASASKSSNWLKSLSSTAKTTTEPVAVAACAAESKKSYCSKTQIYCEAISRALDIGTCKVIPFFGAFLHDLRFIIESVPAITVVCNKNVQKPIEVKEKVFFIFF